MFTRSLLRWSISLVMAVASLAVINTLLTQPTIQARHAATTTCLGSIQACIDAADDGDTILIPAGTYTESLTLSKPVSVTGVNSATTIIHAVAGQRVLTVTGAVISNSVVISGLTFTGGSADYGGGTLITDTAQPLIGNSIFISNDASLSGGGLYAHSDLTLANSYFKSNTATEFGGGIYAVQYLTVTNSEFVGNHTTGAWPTYSPSGGGIYAQSDTLIVSSRFINNSSNDGGGLVNTGPTLTLIDSDFSTNPGGGVSAGSYDMITGYIRIMGGHFSNHSSGAALNAYSAVEISGTQFTSNTAPVVYSPAANIYNSPATIVNAHFENNYCPECSAGGLYFDGFRTEGNLPLTLSNTVFISNSSSAVLAHQSSMVTVIGSRFERNSTPAYGGALWDYDSPLTMIDTEVISNTAVVGTGGVTAVPTTVLIDSRFENNVSNGPYGGGLWTGNLYLTNTTFISNYAAGSGGGVLAAQAYLVGGNFEHNSSLIGGGLAASELFLSDTTFISNTAESGGGSLIFGAATLIGGRFENNRALGPQAAIYGGGGGGLAVASGPLFVTGTQFVSNSTGAIGGGLFYTEGTRSRIVNALFTSNAADSDGAAIYIDAPGQHDLLHLTVADSTFITTSAIAVNAGTVGVTDTIITSHTTAINSTGGTVYEDYNLFSSNVTNTLGSIASGRHSLIGDPHFVDPLRGDYHLRFPSPAIDQGANVGVYTDLDGSPRPAYFGFDIGAYEYHGPIASVFLPVIRK